MLRNVDIAVSVGLHGATRPIPTSSLEVVSSRRTADLIRGVRFLSHRGDTVVDMITNYDGPATFRQNDIVGEVTAQLAKRPDGFSGQAPWSGVLIGEGVANLEGLLELELPSGKRASCIAGTAGTDLMIQDRVSVKGTGAAPF